MIVGADAGSGIRQISQALFSGNPKGSKWEEPQPPNPQHRKHSPSLLALGQGLIQAHMLAGDSSITGGSTESLHRHLARVVSSCTSHPRVLPSVVWVLWEGPRASGCLTGPGSPEARGWPVSPLPSAPELGCRGLLEELWLQVPAPLGGGGQLRLLQPEASQLGAPEPDVTLTLNGKSSPE